MVFCLHVCFRSLKKQCEQRTPVFDLARTFDCSCFSLFWPKSVYIYTFKAKIDIFHTFMLINFLVQTMNTTYRNFNFAFVFLIEKFRKLLQLSVLPRGTNRSKNSKSTRFICAFVVLYIHISGRDPPAWLLMHLIHFSFFLFGIEDCIYWLSLFNLAL